MIVREGQASRGAAVDQKSHTGATLNLERADPVISRYGNIDITVYHIDFAIESAKIDGALGVILTSIEVKIGGYADTVALIRILSVVTLTSLLVIHQIGFDAKKVGKAERKGGSNMETSGFGEIFESY